MFLYKFGTDKVLYKIYLVDKDYKLLFPNVTIDVAKGMFERY